MSITARQSLFFTGITAVFLIAFMLLFNRSASNTRKVEFYRVLEAEAVTKLHLITTAKIDPNILQVIYRENRTRIGEAEVAVYNSEHQLLYHDDINIDFVKETPEMLDEIARDKHIRFMQDKWQVVGLRVDDEEGYFIVTAAAYDNYGFTKLKRQRQSLLITFLFLIMILFILSRYIARKALQPLSIMVNEAKSITANSLYRRLPEGKGKDELEQLAATFNNMLERLDQSFSSQKSFVSNLAHEVRTPLAGILGEIDLCLEKPRKSQEYIRVLNAVHDDAQQISRLTQSLLDLAQAGYDSSAIQFTKIRIDEVVVDALVEVQQSRKDSLIELSIKEDEISDTDLTVMGNEYLLKVAFINVLENACKFSENKKVEVRIYRDQNKTCVAIIDHGPGISVKDQERLFELFYRGKTSQPGTGIGLSLTRRIVEQHQAELQVVSKEGEGSTFIFSFVK